MSLTTGRGPLSARRAGRFSSPIPEDLTYIEPFRRRVRGLAGGRTRVDSQRVVLVHRPGHPPTFAFPVDDVHGAPTEAETAVEGYVRVPWDALETWYEEEEEVFLHPRNPYHRVDFVRTKRLLRVEQAGVVLVETDRTLGVYETALEPLLYVSPDQVRTDLLVASPTTTYCPYKGTASYWNAVVGTTEVADVAWSYEDPLPESLPIRGFLCFDSTRIDVTADIPAGAELPGVF